MDVRFDGRVAIVTGAGRGLGRRYAELLAARGASVIVNDPGVGLEGDGGDRSFAQQVADGIAQTGGKAIANFERMGTEKAARSLVTQAVENFGRLDILINNAGNFMLPHTFPETSAVSLQAVLDTHLFGTLHTMLAAWPHMSSQHYGKILNVTSSVGYIGTRNRLEYGTAKAAIHGLTRNLSHESLDVGIYCNLLAPAALTRPVIATATFPDDVLSAFDTSLVAPTAIWLVHEDCNVNGEAFASMGGTTTHVRIAESVGYSSNDPTPEAIRDNFEMILDEARGYEFPAEGEARGDEMVSRFRDRAMATEGTLDA